jgi:hypothetical protein
MAKFVPQPEELPDGSYKFTLRGDVVLWLRPDSEKYLVAQLARKDRILPPETINFNSGNQRREKLIEPAQEAFNDKEEKDDEGNVTKKAVVNVPNIEEDIGLVATLLGAPTSDGESIRQKLQKKEGASLLDKLLDFAEEHGEFFHTPDKVAHTSVPRNEHIETYPLDSRNFRLWLKGEFRRKLMEDAEAAAIAHREMIAEQMGISFDDTQPIIIPRPPVIRDQTMSDILNELESAAINDGPEHEIHLRTAQGEDGEIYIDLCNDDWEVVRVDAEGWEVINDPPVKFIRSNTMRPLPRPVEGGSVEELREILTLSAEDPDDEAAWRLILAWLIQSLRPAGGQYPILVLLGGQGSAKTNTGRFLRRLVDPSVVKDTSTPKVEHDLYIRGNNSWVISIDNVSSLSPWLSDAICRIATEGGFATRKLYSGREEEVFDALRPFILNGITDVATRPDLLDRCLLVTLPPIKSNRALRQVRAEFDEAAPRILGALLDAMARGLNVDLDTVDASGELPRLADFAQWAVATEEALGGEPGSFMDAYRLSRGEATHTALEAEPIVYALFELSKTYARERPWEGSSKDLLKALNDNESDEALKRSKDWPKNPEKVTGDLKRLAPALLEVGVHVDLKASSSNSKGRLKRIYRIEPPTDRKDSRDGSWDSTKETVPETVPNEKPIDKTNEENRDSWDGWDSSISLDEQDDNEWGEVD